MPTRFLRLQAEFPLWLDTETGNRPSFSGAAKAEDARPIVERFSQALRAFGVMVQTGAFGARMQVGLVNDGPVTVVLDAGRA